MVWAKLVLDTLAVVPDRPYLGAAVVVFVADPAAAAVVVLVANEQADVVRVHVVIARNDLAARRLFGHEMDLCANHRSLPRGGRRVLCGRSATGRSRRSRCACAAAFLYRDHVRTLTFAHSHSAPRTGFVHGSV